MKEIIEDEPLPPWAEKISNGNYFEIGAQLCTRDGRKIGNAFVNKIEFKNDLELAQIITDRGTIIYLTLPELKELFYKPRYVMKINYARPMTATPEILEALIFEYKFIKEVS